MLGNEIVMLIIIQLGKVLISGFIGSLIGAIFLRVACKWVAKMDVPYGQAYWTIFLSHFVNSLIGFLMVVVVVATDAEVAVRAMCMIMAPVGFLLQAGIVSSRHELSFLEACLVNFMMIGIVLGIGVVVGVVSALVIFLLMLAEIC